MKIDVQGIKCNDSILEEERHFRSVVKFHKAQKFNWTLQKNPRT
jgi:hypothetical protein